MEEEKKYFVYKKRYNNSIKSFIEENKDKLKSRLQYILSKNKFTSKYLDDFEVYSLRKKNTIDKYSYIKAFNLKNERKNKVYTEITLNEIIYFEVIEIDDFDKYKKKIISKFAKDHFFWSTRDKDELKKKLSSIKDGLDMISWGKLFSINYNKKIKQKNDLISFVDINYIKTNESYFILKISVKTSEKFQSEFQKIIEKEDIILNVENYNSFYNIIKTKRFISFESVISSLKCRNLEYLISDLNEQVKINITGKIKGYFHNSKVNKVIPSIEFYEVKDIKKFNKDIDFKQNFDTGFDGYYASKDEEIEIFFSNTTRKSQKLIQVVKQIGHGKKVNSKNDLTNYDRIETHYLLESLAFPCVFKAILSEQFDKLNKLKRDIYDFVNDSSNTSILKIFLFFNYNNRYIKLKQSLTQILLTTKRFESEFTKRKITLYTNHTDLREFNPKDRNIRIDNAEKDLLNRIVEEFSNEIKTLDEKTKSTNEIFKSIEELNSYRTNYLLQIISLLIAFLAFILTFEKTKTFFKIIFNKLIE